jgi:tetratricopeptide (TPR) repeat protein
MTQYQIDNYKRLSNTGKRGLLLGLAGAALIALTGCAGEQAGGYRPSGNPAEDQLEEAATYYKQGDYAAAIKRLQGAPDIWNDSKDVRIRGHKLLAFSYCVTNQRALCRQQFSRILTLSPGFELTPAEAGHPIWGGEFKEAKRSITGK